MSAHPAWGTALLLLPGLVACADNSLGVYNTAPSASITSPAGGESYGAGELIELVGIARDSQDDGNVLEITWQSSLDGVLGTDPPDVNGDVYLATSSLSGGDHAITLTVVDTQGESATDTISFMVGQGQSTQGAPTVIIIGPKDGEPVVAGTDLAFVATVTDNEQAWDTLSTVLTSTRDGNFWVGNPDSNGTVSLVVTDLSVGEHTVVLTAEDEDGHIGTDEVTFEVLDDGRPLANILAPTAGVYWIDETLVLEGEVSDLEDDTESLWVEWRSDKDGVIASGAPDSSGYTATGAALSENVHVLTLWVQDSEAKEGTDSVTIEVVDPDNYDDDGDGYTENEGDCDDADPKVNPGATEACDDIDNNCDGNINETWWDSQEQNDTTATAYDLGEVTSSILTSNTVSTTFTLHSAVDVDYIAFEAYDLAILDNVELDVTVKSMPAAGNFVATLYHKDGSSWSTADSASGSGKLLMDAEGDPWSSDDEEWMVAISATSWPSGTCSSTYTLEISAH